MRRAVLAMAIVGLFAGAVYGADELKATGKIEAVTLYRGQAMVTRVVAFDAPAGAVQLVVQDLPDRVVAQSLHASAREGARIRAVRYRATARKEAPQAKVRELDQQVRDIERKMRENASSMHLVEQQEADLNSLRNFTVPTAKVEMAKGVLNVETLQKVTDMMFKHRTDMGKRKLDLQEEARALREELNLLARKRSELTRTHSKTAREAVVFLDKAAAGKASIRLHYLVTNATWAPSYNLRGDAAMTKVSVEYTALAYQMTGEDWNDVKLTLSAAAAQMVADGPALAPLRVRLGKAVASYKNPKIAQQMHEQRRQLYDLNTSMQQTISRGRQIELNWRMNRAADVVQKNELIVAEKDQYVVQDRTVTVAGALSANYPLKGRVTFVSRSENQMIEIARFDLPTQFHYEAVPLLTQYVFRYARMNNTSGLSLLEGRANVYLGGDFVGRGTVPMMAQGQRAAVGFGMDPQLRAWREFVAKKDSDEWLGGNRRTKLAYRLVLHNYSDKAVNIRLLDRMPLVTDQLKVEVADTSEPLSKDAEYVRTRRPRGILRWDTTVPAGSAAGKPKAITYAYTLTYSKDLHIGGEPPDARATKKLQMDFSEELQRGAAH